MHKLLSIIIPNRNNIKYLKRLADSINNQTNKDFEVIVVDDNSTDGSAHFFETLIPSAKIIKSTTWLSMGGARNAGVKSATSEYIYFVDSDDYLFNENAIESIIKSLDGKDCYKVKTTIFNGKETASYQDKGWEQLTDLNREQALQIGHAVWLNVYKRECFIDFPERQLLEDDVHFIEMIDRCNSFGVIKSDNPIDVWDGSNPDQITKSMQYFGSHPINLLEIPKTNFNDQGLKDDFVSSVLRHTASMWDARLRLKTPEAQRAWYIQWKNIIMNLNSGILIH